MIAHRPKTLEVADKVYQVVGGMLMAATKVEDEQKADIEGNKNKLKLHRGGV